MRIGVIGPAYQDAFANNILENVRDMGHDGIELGSAYTSHGFTAIRMLSFVYGAFPDVHDRVQLRVARKALDQECDLVISVDLGLSPATVQQLQRDGAKVALWYPDALSNMGRQMMLLAPYDAIFVKEPHMVDRFTALLGLPVFYLPEACHPRLHRPLAASGSNPYLVVAGSMYPSRVRLLERLLAKGIPLKLYGDPFPRWIGPTPLRALHEGRAIFGDEKARIFRGAAGVLNNLHPGEIDGVNARLFEATGCGAAVLSEFRPVLPDLFDLGHEVLAFGDFDELMDQATRLLHETGLTARIGDAATQRAHRDHTYQRRITALLEKVL
jgi:spore maturation protein CgeB